MSAYCGACLAAEREAWLDLLALAFAAKGTPRAFFEAHADNDPTFDIADVRVLRDSSTSALLATCRIYRRQIQLFGKAVDVAYIGDVATHPEHRRRGLAALVLDNAMQFCETAGLELAVLHASVAGTAEYYGRRGFFACPVKSVVYSLDKSTRADSGAERIFVPNIGTAAIHDGAVDCELLREMMQLHRFGAEQLSGTVVRGNEAYWRCWILPQLSACGGGATLLVVRSLDRRLAAYLVARKGTGAVFGGTLQILEFFAAQEHISASRALFGALVRRAVASSAAGRLQFQPGVAPDDHDLADLLGEHGDDAVPQGRIPGRSIEVCRGALPAEQLWVDHGQMYRVIPGGCFTESAVCTSSCRA